MALMASTVLMKQELPKDLQAEPELPLEKTGMMPAMIQASVASENYVSVNEPPY